MTSPATNPGTVARGAAYRCTACGAELSIVRDDVTVALARSCDCPYDTAVTREQRLPRAVVIDIARDDRAGIILPLELVGGGELVPVGAGQVEGAAGADVVEHERSRP